MRVVNKKERKPINLELFFLDKQELEEMTSSPQFHEFVKEEAFIAIKYAIKNKLQEKEKLKCSNIICCYVIVYCYIYIYVYIKVRDSSRCCYLPKYSTCAVGKVV